MLIPDLLRAVILRWKVEVAILLAVLVLTSIWIVRTPRTYSATATLLFDNRAATPVPSDSSSHPTDMTATLATEAKILQSDAIGFAVARALKQDQRADLREEWEDDTGGEQSFEGWLAERTLSGLSVTTSETGNIINVTYDSSSSQKAAAMANAFASTFVVARLQMSNDSAKMYAKWYEGRITEARKKLEDTQNALTDFQRRRGIISTGSIDAESTRLAELSSQVSSAEGQAADAQARTQAGSETPDVQSSGVVQGLRAQIASKSAEAQQLASELGPNHPAMRAANAELAELRARLAAETSKMTGSLGAASVAANDREGIVRGLLNRQRARMLLLAGDRSELEVLERDVASARTNYDTITLQLSTMRLKSALPALNVQQLDRAEPPLLPSNPNLAARFVMAMIFGVMLAIAAAIALEWRRPRVRSRATISHLTGAPVLATTDIKQIGQVLLLEGGTSR